MAEFDIDSLFDKLKDNQMEKRRSFTIYKKDKSDIINTFGSIDEFSKVVDKLYTQIKEKKKG